VPVQIGSGIGAITVGGDHPVVVQSMTNTDTADAVGTAIQVAQLARAGSELVRITVNSDEAARPCRKFVNVSMTWASAFR